MITRTEFYEFEIRAWRVDARHVDVIVHASPVGSLSRPVRVPFDRKTQRSVQIDARATPTQAIAVGRALADVLLPSPVYALLQATLRDLARQPGKGVRVRLVLDEELTDVPWEFLYRREVTEEAHAGFLVADPLVAIVRGAPLTGLSLAAGRPPARLVFAGALWGDRDGWGVDAEFADLSEEVAKVAAGVDVGVRLDAAATETVVEAIGKGADLFHYTGHTDRDAEGAFVVGAMNRDGDVIESTWAIAPLADRLAAAGTRFAIFNACNSASHAFVRPLLERRIPAMVGVSGVVFSDAALLFSARLYDGLLTGLSIDEAVTHARMEVLKLCAETARCDWGTYVVYLQSRDAVLFPAPESAAMAGAQEAMRASRQESIADVRTLVRRLDGEDYGVLLSDLAARGVLLLGRFTDDRLAVLEALKTALAEHPAGYKPILFTFPRPKARDLIESITTFAGLSRFIIADLTDPSMVREELLAIVPGLPSVPVVPIIARGHEPYTGFAHITRYPWVAPVVEYRDAAELLGKLNQSVLQPAEARATEVVL
jgi:hypothetical protein